MSSYSGYTSPPPSYQYVPPRPTHWRDTRNRAEQTSETEPLIPGRQTTKAWYHSHIRCIAIASAILFVVIISCTAVNTTCQSRNIVQWERDLERRKTDEKIREGEWDRQMAQKRAQEQLWEKKWNDSVRERREKELWREEVWEREMYVSREQWKDHLREQKAREQQHEQAWERQMEQKREEERIRERQWDVSQEQRERLGLYWDEPAPGRCTAHGVRDYHARLLNATPFHYNWLQPCEDMPILIHGSHQKASRCERMGNEIWGHWSVERESVCTPFFEDWRDNGCIAPGSQLRLASARLDYLPSGENGLELCGSTPHKFWDRYFSHPTTCAETNGDVWGYWEVEDGAC